MKKLFLKLCREEQDYLLTKTPAKSLYIEKKLLMEPPSVVFENFRQK